MTAHYKIYYLLLERIQAKNTREQTMYLDMYMVKRIAEERIAILYQEAEEARLLRAANQSDRTRKFQMPHTLSLLTEKIADERYLNLFRQTERYV